MKPHQVKLKTVETREMVERKILAFVTVNPNVGAAKIYDGIKTGYGERMVQKIIKKLAENERLKNTTEKPKDPKYIINDVDKFNTQSAAYAFKDQICYSNLRERTNSQVRSMIKEYDDSRKNQVVDMILRLGLISYYTCLSGLEKGLSQKLNIKQKKETQKLWLRNAMSFENNLNDCRPSSHLLAQISHNILTDKTNALTHSNEDDNRVSIKHTNTESIKEVKKLKKVFADLFPDWYEYFQDDKKSNKRMKGLLRKVCIKHPEYLLE